MKNFKIFMKAVDEEATEWFIDGVLWAVLILVLYLCAISDNFLKAVIGLLTTVLVVEVISMFSKWSKKVMKKYKQLKGESYEKN